MPEIVGHTNGSIVEVPSSQSTLQLTCIAKNGRPAAELKWLRNGTEITTGTEYTVEEIPNDKRENAKSVLEIDPNYPEDNGAIYTCQAINSALVNEPLRVHVVLSVQRKYKCGTVLYNCFICACLLDFVVFNNAFITITLAHFNLPFLTLFLNSILRLFERILKKLWEKEKMLISAFSPFPTIFSTLSNLNMFILATWDLSLIVQMV